MEDPQTTGRVATVTALSNPFSTAHTYLYCFSFAPNYISKGAYPSRLELYSYLTDVARQWQLDRHVRFNTTVTKAEWEDDNGWKVLAKFGPEMEAATPEEYEFSCRYLISAVGQLHTPHVPSLLGLEKFTGKILHTALWDEDVKFDGKRVAIIGNGATGVQVIPEVGPRAKQLTVFQRSPSWIIPRGKQSLSKLQHSLYKYVPTAREYYRSRILNDQDARHGIVINEHVREIAARFSRGFLNSQIPLDHDLRTRLTPSYPFGCKRVLLSNDFYRTMQQAHVALETRPILSISKNGVQTENGELPFDLIILATGFHAQSFLSHIEITGKSGQKICSTGRGLNAYQGVAVENMPNFAMLYGPNTNLSHVSVMLMIEAQARYICAMVEVVMDNAIREGVLAICPKPQAVLKYNEALQANLKNTVFAKAGCRSWYRAQDGVVTNNWPDTAMQYQKNLSVLNWDEYDLSRPNFSNLKRGDMQSLGGSIESQPALMIALLAWVASSVLALLRLSEKLVFGS